MPDDRCPKLDTTCGCCSTMLKELIEFTKCPHDEDLVEHVKARVRVLEEALTKIAEDINRVVNDKCNNPTDHANCNWMLVNRIEDICDEMLAPPAGTPQEKP